MGRRREPPLVWQREMLYCHRRVFFLPSSGFFDAGRGSREGSLIAELLSDRGQHFEPVKLVLQSRHY